MGFLGVSRETCATTCASRGLSCTKVSRANQSNLNPTNIGGAVAAFQEAGSSCSTIHLWRFYASSPLQAKNGKCIGIGNSHALDVLYKSTCDGVPKNPGDRALCYCEPGTREGCQHGEYLNIDMKLFDDEGATASACMTSKTLEECEELCEKTEECQSFAYNPHLDEGKCCTK